MKNDKLSSIIIAILLILSLGLFTINDYSLTSSDKMAVVLAVGIDEIEGEKYGVTCEVVTPAMDGESENARKHTVIYGEGSTIDIAIRDGFGKLGWNPKLKYCNIVIFGKDIVEKNAMNVLTFFIRSEKLVDTSLFAVAEDKAKDILLASTPLDNSGANAVQKIELEKSIMKNSVAKISIKNFVKNYYDEGIDAICPIIKLEDSQIKDTEEDKQKMNDEKSSMFNMQNSAIFDRGQMVGELNETQTSTYLLLNGKNLHKRFKVPVKGETYNFEILAEKINKNIDFIDGKPTIEIELTLKVIISDSTKIDTIGEIAHPYDIDDEALSAFEKEIEQNFEKTFYLSKEANSDFMGIGKHLHKFHLKKWRNYVISLEDSKEYYKTTKLNMKVKVVKPEISR